MKVTRLIIIGGSGVIGSALLRLARVARVPALGTALTRLQDGLLAFDMRIARLRSVIPDIGPSDVVFLLAGYISPAWIFSHPQAAHYLNYDCSMRLVDEVESAADTNTVAGIVKATAIQIHVLVNVTLSHAFYCGLARLRALGHEGRYAIVCTEAVWWRCHRHNHLRII